MPTIKELKKGVLYSEELGIDLKKGTDAELFKWFLASRLFGNMIGENISRNTYMVFKKYKLLTPRKILKAGWKFLVTKVMREGGFARYDESTSTELLGNCHMLLHNYRGSLKELHDRAADEKDLEKRIMEFKGAGPVTANIFLRELRPHWKKANPEPLPIVKKLAKKHKINLGKMNQKSVTFARVEAGLIRLRHSK